IQAEIQTNCLTQKGIECRSCQDACEPYAIRFAPHLSGIAKPTVDLDKCTGCGECVRGCPVDAIRITPAARPETHDAVARNEV
ncbi:MAG: 4Fe-4S dicluster domain-containing protein, partial [Enterobacterales bacterium]|nr:4Fe-4S dicluster domain-containing protein [Enterobacterales bacterium]